MNAMFCAGNSKINVYRYSTASAGYGVHVSFYPTALQQAQQSGQGLDGQFVIKYDVDRRQDAGELEVGHSTCYDM